MPVLCDRCDRLLVEAYLPEYLVPMFDTNTLVLGSRGFLNLAMLYELCGSGASCYIQLSHFWICTIPAAKVVKMEPSLVEELLQLTWWVLPQSVWHTLVDAFVAIFELLKAPFRGGHSMTAMTPQDAAHVSCHSCVFPLCRSALLEQGYKQRLGSQGPGSLAVLYNLVT